jgi:hypothetical protein
MNISNPRMMQILAICIFALIVFALFVKCDDASSEAIEKTFTLTWTAVGDDGLVGIADHYDLRYSTEAITESNWNEATQILNVPVPHVAGTPESCIVTIMAVENIYYYFAIKAVDEMGNAGIVSNIVEIRWIDKIAPGQITDLGAHE